jgi:hypothetical protein
MPPVIPLTIGNSGAINKLKEHPSAINIKLLKNSKLRNKEID